MRLALQIFQDPSVIVPALARTVGRPGWSHYLAYDGATPDALAALHLAGAAGWFGWGGTLPSRRGRWRAIGAARAPERRRRGPGVKWLTLETADALPGKTNAWFRNVERAGFRILCRRPSHAFSPRTSPRD